MTLTTASPVPATETGIVCARCSTRGRNGVQVRHASVAAVRLCQTGPTLVTAGRVERGELVVKVTTLPPVPSDTVSPQTTAWNTHDDVEPGRYAVRGTDGVVKFYKIDKGRGKWEGTTFVSVMASDEEHPVHSRTTRVGILAAILVDVDGARRLYGQEIGRCARCNRTLTDETSRAYGMGPECRSK